MRINHVIWAMALGVAVTACKKDDGIDEENPIVSRAYENGILVSNEGPFNNGTGTVNFISNDLSTTEAAIFNSVNDADLGNIVQSIGFTDDKAYIVANNSNKITVVDRYSFVKEAEITEGINNPRYFVQANGMGYVTNWGDTSDESDDFIAVINLQTNVVEKSIAVVLGPEEVKVRNGKIYVAHQGAFGQNNKITVIDSSTNEVATVITVGDVPNSLQFDSSGDLWVLCGGKPAFTGDETTGAIYKINTIDDTATGSLSFPAIAHPDHLVHNGNDFYYKLDDKIFKLSETATTIPVTSDFNGIDVYAMEAFDGKLYVTDAKDFASNGTLTIYDLTTTVAEQSFEVGIIPGGIYFN